MTIEKLPVKWAQVIMDGQVITLAGRTDLAMMQNFTPAEWMKMHGYNGAPVMKGTGLPLHDDLPLPGSRREISKAGSLSFVSAGYDREVFERTGHGLIVNLRTPKGHLLSYAIETEDFFDTQPLPKAMRETFKKELKGRQPLCYRINSVLQETMPLVAAILDDPETVPGQHLYDELIHLLTQAEPTVIKAGAGVREVYADNAAKPPIVLDYTDPGEQDPADPSKHLPRDTSLIKKAVRGLRVLTGDNIGNRGHELLYRA